MHPSSLRGPLPSPRPALAPAAAVPPRRGGVAGPGAGPHVLPFLTPGEGPSAGESAARGGRPRQCAMAAPVPVGHGAAGPASGEGPAAARPRRDEGTGRGRPRELGRSGSRAPPAEGVGPPTFRKEEEPAPEPPERGRPAGGGSGVESRWRPRWRSSSGGWSERPARRAERGTEVATRAGAASRPSGPGRAGHHAAPAPGGFLET